MTMSDMTLVLAERAAPRYTSYPTAPQFSASVGPDDYARWLVDFRARQAPVANAGAASVEKTDKRAQRQAAAALRQQLAPHKREADKLEKELGGIHDKLAALEEKLGDSALYENARKDELRDLLARQASLKAREAEVEEAWLVALETLENLQAQLEGAE